MKKIKTIILLSVVIALGSACQKDKYELSIPESGITLGAPSNGATLNLNDETVPSFAFSWDGTCEGGNAIVMSASPYLIGDTVLIPVGESAQYDIDVLDADAYFSKLGVGGGKTGTIYWTVKPYNKLSVAATEIRSFTAQRIKTQLLTPEDQSSVVLNADTPDESVLFSWQKDDSNAEGYQLCFSLDGSMKGITATIDAGSTGECSLSHQQLQGLITKLPIALFSQNTVYWNVMRKSTGTLVSRTAQVLKITGMLVFTDVRGDESITYRVAKVKYSTGDEVIWLAENLRTTKYPDGTDLSASNYEYWNAPSDLSPELQTAYGKYYSIKLVDKLAPKGWKVPTSEDYKLLLNEAILTGGSVDVLKHKTYWNWSGSASENANAWGIGLVPAGFVVWTGADGTVGNYNGSDNNCYLLARDLSSKVVLFSDWGMNNEKTLYYPDAWGGAPVRLIYVGE